MRIQKIAVRDERLVGGRRAVHMRGMSLSDDFISYSMSPERSREERFAVLRVVEALWHQAKIARNPDEPYVQRPAREECEYRRLNPAWEPVLVREEVAAVAAIVETGTMLMLHSHSDRPLRDVGVLRFFPALKSVSLSEFDGLDLSPLATLANVEELTIFAKLVEDFGALRGMVRLRKVHINAWRPWPDLSALAELKSLESLTFNGNPLVLEGLPAMPAMRVAHIAVWVSSNLPLRDARRLPEMPALRTLMLDGVDRLDGMDRYSELVNLELRGCFIDVQPLAVLHGLTKLVLTSDRLGTVAPLTALPKLRSLEITSELPRDYSVLTDAPRLREVTVKQCKINELEVAALNAALNAGGDEDDEEFLAPEPCAVGPMRYVVASEERWLRGGKISGPMAPDYDGDEGTAKREGVWFEKQMTAALDGVAGDGPWGSIHGFAPHGRTVNVMIHSLEAAEQLAELIEAARQVLSKTRFEWGFTMVFNLLEDWVEPEVKGALARRSDEEIEREGNEEYKRTKKEREEFLERQHVMNLRVEDGEKVNPEDFAAPEAPSPKPKPKRETAGGGFSDLMQFLTGRARHPRADEFTLALRIEGDTVLVRNDGEEVATRLFGRGPDAAD